MRVRRCIPSVHGVPAALTSGVGMLITDNLSLALLIRRGGTRIFMPVPAGWEGGRHEAVIRAAYEGRPAASLCASQDDVARAPAHQRRQTSR